MGDSLVHVGKQRSTMFEINVPSQFLSAYGTGLLLCRQFEYPDPNTRDIRRHSDQALGANWYRLNIDSGFDS
jgi:hypothetical protein